MQTEISEPDNQEDLDAPFLQPGEAPATERVQRTNGTAFEMRYLDLPNTANALTRTVDEKWAMLARLGIPRAEGDDPLFAWQRTMMNENGLDPTKKLADYGVTLFDATQGLKTFIWAIA
ncbi:MAG: hypothetical protein HC853_02125 [Anaerolineae bacterium]|nr:hypothetical protein [Anaerolineae bacterium]